VQLSLAGIGAPGQAYCTNCGETYAPKRQIIRGGVHYCPDPRCQKIASAARSARYRQRQKKSKGKTTSRRKRSKLRYRGVFDSKTNDPLFS
jgi:hypothetical protein